MFRSGPLLCIHRVKRVSPRQKAVADPPCRFDPSRNRSFSIAKSIVVCALTSNLKRARAPGNVLLQRGEANLKKESVVNISEVITVDKSDLLENIGSLSQARVKEVVEGIKFLVEPREIR